jgi:hypothetical protein
MNRDTGAIQFLKGFLSKWKKYKLKKFPNIRKLKKAPDPCSPPLSTPLGKLEKVLDLLIGTKWSCSRSSKRAFVCHERKRMAKLIMIWSC